MDIRYIVNRKKKKWSDTVRDRSRTEREYSELTRIDRRTVPVLLKFSWIICL